MHVYFCNGCDMTDCVAIVVEHKDEPERCLRSEYYTSNWKEAVV